MELACGIANDVFETRLGDAIEFALTEIKRVGRDLGRNAPYKKRNPHMYIYMVQKFSVMKHALRSSMDERALQPDDE